MEKLIAELNEHYRAYKMLEVSLIQKKARLMMKIPELKKNLEIISLLIDKKSAGALRAGGGPPEREISAACLLPTAAHRPPAFLRHAGDEALVDFELADGLYARAK